MKGKTITTIVVATASVVGFVTALILKFKKKVVNITRSAGKTC